ncbi:hypothetical protein T4D_8224 [Trichinella pseudospiralis]|uniref:Uncharacterized protein n=1 Tax=Trichinella pseudospiralis TaxID=6337 RepID=A0A0V1DMS7_TRIPS|nr:hypothetical protein T4D_8224 [Trichinella pseudospiralis]
MGKRRGREKGGRISRGLSYLVSMGWDALGPVEASYPSKGGC